MLYTPVVLHRENAAGFSETVIIATADAPESRYGTLNGGGTQDTGTAADPRLSAPDVIVDQYDGDHTVKTLEKLYEPYFWKK